MTLPGRKLVLSSNATAAAGLEGSIPDKRREELALDAIHACAPELADDVVAYASKNGRSP